VEGGIWGGGGCGGVSGGEWGGGASKTTRGGKRAWGVRRREETNLLGEIARARGRSGEVGMVEGREHRRQ